VWTCCSIDPLSAGQEDLSPEETHEVVEIHNRLKGIGSADTGTVGDDCDTEYKTNADVCVKISDVNLDCRKNYSDEYYRSCEVTVQIIAVDHTLMLTSSAKPKLDTQGMVHIPDAVIHPPKMKITAYTLMNLILNP